MSPLHEIEAGLLMEGGLPAPAVILGSEAIRDVLALIALVRLAQPLVQALLRMRVDELGSNDPACEAPANWLAMAAL